MEKMNNKAKNIIFNNFSDYWYYARHLSEEQRKTVFDSLPFDQQEVIRGSYDTGKWSDVFTRNKINDILDDLKEKYNKDILEIRCKVLSGRSVYVSIKFWDDIFEQLKQFKSEHTDFVLEGIKAVICEENKDVVLLVRDFSDEGY